MASKPAVICMTGDGCGLEASRELRWLIAGQEVVCKGNKPDRNGWPLVVCWIAGLKLNATMFRSDWAVTSLGHDFDGEEAEE
jgi:endonuclease YncB( thermonuclease family)